MRRGGAQAASELDNCLHGLAITDQELQKEAAPLSQTIEMDENTSGGSSSYYNPDTPAQMPSQGGLQSQPYHETQTSRSSKRRPNQAQRRQMSTNFSMSMASDWTSADYASSQLNSQYHRSTIHPSCIQHSIHPTGVTQTQFLSGHRVELTPPTTPLYRITAPQFPRHLDPYTSRRCSGRRSEDFSKLHTTHSFLTPSTQHCSRQYSSVDDVVSQSVLLDRLCYDVVSKSEIDRHEIAQKEGFRRKIEVICQRIIADYEKHSNGAQNFSGSSVKLKCFGSLSSGFATKSSDMDLGLFSPCSKKQPYLTESPIPRLIEKGFLGAGYGARLLSRTRVPIIKLCEMPSEELRNSLIAERAKWEGGADPQVLDGPEDSCPNSKSNFEDVNDMPKLEHMAESLTFKALQLNNEQPSNTDERPRLQQNPNSSLIAYYGLAKRVLRRAGGRDITLSNHRDFAELDWIILNQVCLAFVCGLCDDVLRQQLASRISLSSNNSSMSPCNRSLAGVFSQIEGEQLLLDWKHSSVNGAFDGATDEVQQAIKSWEQIQNKPDFGIDPLSYDKELQNALERLRRQPAIQLMQLAQDAKETPTQYHARAYRIMRKLNVSNIPGANLAAQRFVDAYISGIQDASVRAMVSSAYFGSQRSISFDELGPRHNCLQLARDLERFINDVACYQDLKKAIQQYLRLLKGPLVKVHINQNQVAFRIPITEESLPAISKIRSMADPRKILTSRQRDKLRDPLEFPTSGVGVQCDINFSAHLALQNTKLLRCYSLTDPRVRPIVLFVKKWAKDRGINSGYRGTLSSYGFVLMVLHYLVNISRPFVCPNLQHLAPPTDGRLHECQNIESICDYNVNFWQDEGEISRLAASHQLTYNAETIGQLLRGFFEYFAHSGPLSSGIGKGFDWGRDVLSLRTPGGLLTKQDKGWTGAKTIVEGQVAVQNRSATQSGNPIQIREVRHRYLFAIEDPFELDHNVARTVTHNGIVSIRDEFRRAWRIIRTSSNRGWSEDLLREFSESSDDSDSFANLLEEIHGPLELWPRP